MHRPGHRCRTGLVVESLVFDRTDLAGDFERIGMAVEPVESECTCRVTDVARTGVAVEFVEHERNNMAVEIERTGIAINFAVSNAVRCQGRHVRAHSQGSCAFRSRVHRDVHPVRRV